MALARRMTPSLSQSDRDAIRTAVLGDVRDSLYSSPAVDQDVLDALDERVGDDPRDLTWDDVQNMSAEEINENWAAVSKVLEGGRRRAPADDEDAQQEAQTRKVTGVQPLNAHNAAREHRPLSIEAVRNMSEAEISARWAEVSQVLSRGGS